MYKYRNYYKRYGRIMQFNKNKSEPFHRWYPFVEGYSKEFINSILAEIKKENIVCLEPFSGSGTTALELQNKGIKCYSFEVNPLMYMIARVKMENHYDVTEVEQWLEYVCNERKRIKIDKLSSKFKTLYQSEDSKKWNYNTEIGKAVEKLKIAIEAISDNKYSELFKVTLASILLDVSNLYRNGKCLSYKKKWETREITEEYVFKKFDDKIKKEIIEDITNCKRDAIIDNKSLLFNKDSRIGIEEEVEDNSIDLVITSPPYLNSRDYTDTYMLELKTLGFTKDNKEIEELRKKTLRSHVQIKWKDSTNVENERLKKTLNKLEEAAKNSTVWNESIIDMVRLYFVDMQSIFKVIFKKLKVGGKVYFNVSNSAYFNVLIDTLRICASIAEDEGFTVKEIRRARWLNTSPQQKDEIGKLLEGVIILEK